MIRLILLLLFSLLISCKTDKDPNFIGIHFEDEHIKQDIENRDAEKLYQKGVRLLNNQNLEEAKVKLNKAAKIEKDPNIYNALGILFLNEKNKDSALFYFQKSIEADAEFWPGYIAKTRTLISQLEYEKARENLNPIIRNADSQYWKSYANFYLTVISINTGEDCDTVKEYLKRSESLQNDPYLGDYYKKIKGKFDINCS